MNVSPLTISHSPNIVSLRSFRNTILFSGEKRRECGEKKRRKWECQPFNPLLLLLQSSIGGPLPRRLLHLKQVNAMFREILSANRGAYSFEVVNIC
jgi:hypothetical protein